MSVTAFNRRRRELSNAREQVAEVKQEKPARPGKLEKPKRAKGGDNDAGG